MTASDASELLAGENLAGDIAARLVLERTGQRAWFWGFVLVVLSGPALAYARTTWGEMLATGLLVCLVAATVLQAPPPVVALAAAAACLTKLASEIRGEPEELETASLGLAISVPVFIVVSAVIAWVWSVAVDLLGVYERPCPWCELTTDRRDPECRICHEPIDWSTVD